MEEKDYSVSEAVQKTGVPSHVLRYWEEELELAIKRTSQGHRVYSREDLELFLRVRKLKEKGIQLKAIKVLLEETGENQGEYTWTNEVRRLEENPQSTETLPQAYGASLAEKQENVQRFEEILKQMIRDVMEEQNEKLEQAITDVIRQETESLFLQYFGRAAQEAAAEGSIREKKRSLRAVVAGCLGRKK